MTKLKKLFSGVLLLVILFLLSCCENSSSRNVFYLDNDAVGELKKTIVYDFNGELAHDSSFCKEYVLCRQQQVEGSDYYFAVLPEENYVGFYNEELEIRLFQHQQYLPSDIEISSKPQVAFGPVKQQKFKSICGGLQVLLKGSATVTALRFADNDSIDRLWGNYVVRYIGKDNQQLLAVPSSEGDNEVWLDCPKGAVLSNDTAKVFTVMLPPGAFYRGFAMDVFDHDSLLYHAATENNITIKRGKICKMPEVVIP